MQHILVVDDSATMRRMVQASLRGLPELSPFSAFAYSLMAFTGVAVVRAIRRAEREDPHA